LDGGVAGLVENESYTLLFVDDDTDFLKLCRDFFEKRGYTVVCLPDAKDIVRLLCSTAFDCVILDIDLPTWDGFDVCASIRSISSVPIIFLSACTEEEHRVRGLLHGGDDYVCKPCSFLELEARIHLRIKRRIEDLPPEILQFGLLKIDTGQREVWYGEEKGNFSRIEFEIIAFLARHPGRIFSYEQLYEMVWREPINLGRHAIQARISEVRRKLYFLCPEKEYIETIRRQGYRFTPCE
jgi:DNA-binding response OmpR family regulator